MHLVAGYLEVGQREQQLSVKAAWTTQCPINGIDAICGSDHDHLSM